MPGYSHYGFAYLWLFLRSTLLLAYFLVFFSFLPYTFSYLCILSFFYHSSLHFSSRATSVKRASHSSSFPVYPVQSLFHSLHSQKPKGLSAVQLLPSSFSVLPRIYFCHLPYVKWDKLKQTNVVISSCPTELSHHLLAATVVFISFPLYHLSALSWIVNHMQS